MYGDLPTRFSSFFLFNVYSIYRDFHGFQKNGEKYLRATEIIFLTISLKQCVRRCYFVPRALLKKFFTKFLSIVCEYFFPIFPKTMNELGNYAKKLTICS